MLPPTSGERDWIESLRQRLAVENSKTGRPRGVRVGIGDDCAILQMPRGHEMLVTTDFSLEGVHFRRDWHPPESVGHRCLARGLSDLAAMGAQPLAAFLSLALPMELVRRSRNRPSWRDRFFDGFMKLANHWNVPLAGGDTAQSPKLALADIVLVGSAPRGRALLRSGAQAGDRIYVTGFLGGAAAELAQLVERPGKSRGRRSNKNLWGISTMHPHLYPEPRIAIGQWLLRHRRATAAIDISDGLSTDLDHLCEESGLAATIDASKLPVHALAQEDRNNGLALALHGGEDYELLFTTPPEVQIPRRIAGVPVTCIGEIRRASPRKPRMILVDEKDDRRRERPLLPHGWEHYKNNLGAPRSRS